MPEERKNTDYWLKRRKNNEAARRSREKRKMNDVLLERRVMILAEENKQLRAQLLAIKMKYGELDDLCTPFSSLPQDCFDRKSDTTTTEPRIIVSSELSSFMCSEDSVTDSIVVPRNFTSKVFTNASGDTSATVHVNKIAGNSQLYINNNLSLLDFTPEANLRRQSKDEDIRDSVENGIMRIDLSKFDFSQSTQHYLKSTPSTNNVRPDACNDSDRRNLGESGNRREQTNDENSREKTEAPGASESFNYDILKSININNQNAYLRESHVTTSSQSKDIILPPSSILLHPAEKSTVNNSSHDRTDTLRDINVTANPKADEDNFMREQPSAYDTTEKGEVTDKGQKSGYNSLEANGTTKSLNNDFTASNTRHKSPVRLPHKLRLKKMQQLHAS